MVLFRLKCSFLEICIDRRRRQSRNEIMELRNLGMFFDLEVCVLDTFLCIISVVGIDQWNFRIEAPNAHMDHNLPLILTMDWTANYLFLSDIERKVNENGKFWVKFFLYNFYIFQSLYVVQMVQTNGQAKFVSFSEFPLVQPALSMAVVEACKKRFRPFSPDGVSELGQNF